MLICTRVLAVLALCLLYNGDARCASPPTPAPHRLSPDELYARRALRRVRLVIEMRLLQLREERLECVRLAILRNLPPDLRPRERGEGARRLDPETCEHILP
jgi:hypothetical protein